MVIYKFFFRLVIVLFLLIHLWFVYITFQYPYLGITLKKGMHGEWVVYKLETESASLEMNIQVGDIINRIDGKPADEHPTVKKWRSVEQARTLELDRKGEPLTVELNKGNAANPPILLPILVELLCLSLAGMLYWKTRHSRSARFLSLVFLNIGFIFASIGASQRGDTLGKAAMSSLMMLLPVVFLHFLFVFLKEKGEIQFPFRFLRYLYIIFAILLLPVLTLITPISFLFYQYSIQFVITFFLFGLLLNFFFLAYVSMKFRNEVSYLSTIIRTVWWALAISFFPFAFLSFVPQLMGEDGISSLYTSWFVLFFPIAFSYLIMSKQLYDIDLVLRRFVFTTVISMVPACAIVLLTAVIFQKAVTVQHLLLSFIFILMLLSFVMYSLEYFATKLEAVMFPRKYHLQNALKKIAVNLQSISSFRELKDIILVDIVNTLQVFGAAIVFKYKDRMETVLEGDIELSEVEWLISSESMEHPFLRRFEINRHEEYTSYLIIARKRTNTFLGMEEIQWLNLIISYLAVSLENMHLISKLHMRLQRLAAQIPNEDASQDFIWFRKLMFELQEAERKRIATDLHDTTLQDLFFLKKRFSSIVDKLNFSKEDMERMRNIIDYVEIINTNLRQSCFELHPHLLYEIGLIRTIQKVIDNESSLCPFRLEFIAEGAEQIEAWDMDSKRHFFRIIQELLNNAKKHSQASWVSIAIKQENDCILLTYEDDGVGFTVYKVNEAELEIGASGTGMEQMKSRVLYLDGQMDFRTGRGKGLQIWISVPLKEVLTA